MVLAEGLLIHRTQRFGTGSATAVPQHPDSGSPPIGREPEPAAEDVEQIHGPAPRGRIVIAPRLLNLHQMATYLGCSYWTARDWVLAGRIRAVPLPPLQPREGGRARTNLRRVLLDRRALDQFIDGQKAEAAGKLQSRAGSTERRCAG